ncbi:hypothetical protein LR002_01600 [Candidatus Gracilibacteria bacterium]|nr:hypothetical protein [Candidatus Gracilibacteria bacterium]
MSENKKNFSEELKRFFSKENFLILKEKMNFIHWIVFILLIIGTTNILVNKNVFQAEIKPVQVEKVFKSNIPQQSIVILGDEIKKDKTTGFQYLFSIFDLNEINQPKSKTIFRDGIKRYVSVYEIEGGLDTYLKVKSVIENYIEIKNTKGSIFEANNLGVYSFYYNDEKKGTVYLVALIGGQVFGFEYNKGIHEEMKIFTKSIAENLF